MILKIILKMDFAWIESVLRRNQMENEIFKVLKFEVDDDSVGKGGNYASLIKRCKLELILASGRRTKKTFVCKLKEEGKNAEVMDHFEVFKTEINVYQNVLTQMECLMDEFDDHREPLWCQMYGYKPYNLIVLEDLKEIGYEISERRNSLDLNQAKLFLRSIGRFHAMSKIIIERGILSATDFPPFYMAKMQKITVTMIEKSFIDLSKVVLEYWPAEWNDFGKWLEKIQPVIVKKLKDLTIEERNRESAFLVLNHGDSWTTNMMFKYTEDVIPISLKLLDFQVSHVSSYIWDVVYFLYSSVHPEVRRSNIKDLLKIYWESLDSNLRRYGYNKYIPTLNDVMEEAERKDVFSFYVLALLHPGMTADVDNAFNLDKLAEGKGGFVSQSAFLSPRFLKECAEDFIYFMNKGLL